MSTETTQTEMFPATELDEALAVLDHLLGEKDKAKKASDAAWDKYDEALERVAKQRHVVARLQAMMPAAGVEADGVDGPECMVTGTMTDLHTHDRALSADEVSARYEAGRDRRRARPTT